MGHYVTLVHHTFISHHTNMLRRSLSHGRGRRSTLAASRTSARRFMLTGPARIVSLAHKLPATVRTQQELSDAFLDKLVTHDAKAFEKLHPRRPSAHQFDNQLFTHDDHVDRPLDAVANDHGSPPRQSFDKIKSIFNNAGVSKRGMLMPLKFSHSPVERDTESIYVETGDKLISLAAEVCQTALEASTVSPSSVAAGVLVMELSGCPPRDTQLFFGKNLGLRNDLVQDPIIGLGCAGGSKGLSHTADRLKAYPQQACLLTAAECTSRVWSTEFERRLASKVADGALALATGDEQGLKTAQYEMMNSAVIAALMGDGAAACVVVGAEHPLFHARDKLPGPVIVDSDRTTLPNTLGLVYTRTHDVGQRMFLSHKIPQVVPPAAVPLISGLLKKHKLQVSDIEHWVIHPGGPKVLLNIEELCKFRTGAPSPKTGAIDLTAPLAWSWKALVDAGNCMSVSVFHVLHELQTSATPPKPGSRGILFGVGPGMRMEALLLQW